MKVLGRGRRLRERLPSIRRHRVIVKIECGDGAAYGGCGGVGNLIREERELFVEYLPSFPLLLLHLDLIFVSISVFPLAVPCFVELDIRCFTEELDVLSERHHYKIRQETGSATGNTHGLSSSQS
jgi:hypothetical protein